MSRVTDHDEEYWRDWEIRAGFDPDEDRPEDYIITEDDAWAMGLTPTEAVLEGYAVEGYGAEDFDDDDTLGAEPWWWNNEY